jgi:VanZ family protein
VNLHARLRPLWRPAFWCCALAVLLLALVPTPQLQPAPGWDKLDHVAAFGTLALLAVLAWPARWHTAMAALLAYAWTIEVLQSFTPTRTPDAQDVAADAAGLLLAWVIVRGARLLQARRAGARGREGAKP